MARLIQDAKDVEEATAFATGAGTGVNPQGVLTGATGTVAAGTAAFAVAHGYALLEALPPRFRPNGTFVANLAQYNRIRQLDTAGGANIWVQNLTQGSATTRPATSGDVPRQARLRVVGDDVGADGRVEDHDLRRLQVLPDRRPDRHDRRAGAPPVRGDEPAADRCAWPAGLLAEHEPCPERRGVQGARHHLVRHGRRAPCPPPFCREPLKANQEVRHGRQADPR
jgi:hypothetical protein